MTLIDKKQQNRESGASLFIHTHVNDYFFPLFLIPEPPNKR